jgi:hypothetical protein
VSSILSTQPGSQTSCLRRSTSLRVCLPGAPEITTIKVHNTEQAIRNVFVLNDRFLIVFEYHKAQTVTHHAFYVVRYLTLELSLALYQYLVYIRPFADFLRSQLGLGHLRSNEFLFEDPHRKKRHLSPVQATDILRRVTASFPTTMTLALYRQASKAIAKRYITELMKRINLYEPSRATDPRNLLAMGAGHHTKTLLTAYAIDSAYPSSSRSCSSSTAGSRHCGRSGMSSTTVTTATFGSSQTSRPTISRLQSPRLRLVKDPLTLLNKVGR